MLLLDVNAGAVNKNKRGEYAVVRRVKTDTLSFFRDEKGEVRYCKKCEKCSRNCKQSFRVLSIQCNKYKKIINNEA